jgi:TolB-like protein
MAAIAGDRLDSWKEIAAYLNRSVRTVKRWEHEEGLPVHRHIHHTQGSVYAHKSEVDAWRENARRVEPAAPRDAEWKSIAVLSFTNLSNDPDSEYFADGLTEEVTASLSKVHSLRVTSRTSSRALRDTGKGAKAIAAQLRVRYLLEGSIRRAGNQLRVTAQLIDAPNDEHLWAETFDGTLEDIFAIQEHIARLIVDALKLRLSASEQERLSERPIDNLPAYECYLRARHEGWRWRRDSIDRAVHLLQEGLKMIGDNARLYAALGLAYLQYREAGIDLSDRPLTEAEACVAKVFALDPKSASGLQLRGWIHYSRAEIQDAVRDLKAALEAEPSNADTLLLLTNCCLISGRVAVARPLIARLLTIDPLTPVTRCMPAFADLLEGHFAAAVEPYRLMFEMDSSNPMARLFYMWVLILNGRDAGAEQLVTEFPREVRGTVPARIAFFLSFAIAGKQQEAVATITRDIEAVATATDLFPRFLAQGFAFMKMPEPAMRWLRVAVDRGFINYPFLAHHDPFFSALRDDPQYIRLLEDVRERWEAFEA